MVYVPGLTTRQNNFLAVGGAQKNIFFLFKSAFLNIGKSLKLYKQIYETLNFEIVDRPGLQSLLSGPFFRTTVRIRTFLWKLVRIWSVLCVKSPIFC